MAQNKTLFKANLQTEVVVLESARAAGRGSMRMRNSADLVRPASRCARVSPQINRDLWMDDARSKGVSLERRQDGYPE
jgi:hypothetical protein